MKLISRTNSNNSISYTPDSYFSGNDRIISFEINPVSIEEEYLGGETKFVLTVKTPDLSNPGQYLTLETKEIKVNIRKTAPIRLGILPITGCRWSSGKCFASTNSQKVSSLARIGNKMIHNMFPISEQSKVSAVVLPAVPIASVVSEGDDYYECHDSIVDDLNSVKKTLSTLNFFDFTGAEATKMTHLHAAVSEDYFLNYHRVCATDLTPDGLGAMVGKYLGSIKNVSIGIESHPRNVPHELGHTLGLDNVPSSNNFFSGYSNYNLNDDDFTVSRGILNNQTTIMKVNNKISEIGLYKDQWVSKAEYEHMFRVHTVNSSKITSLGSRGIRVSLSMHQGNFKLLSSYMTDDTEFSESPSGNYLVKVLDINKNELSSARYLSSQIATDREGDLLSFDMVIPPHAVFLDIYKISLPENELVFKIVIPADTLMDEVKYIPEQAVRGSFNGAINAIKSVISDYRDELIGQNIKGANSVLSSKVIPTLQKYIKEDYEPLTLIDANRELFNRVIISSLLRLKSGQPISLPVNSLIKIQPVGSPVLNQFSKIKVINLKKPDNKEYKFVYEAWFDGVPIALKNENGGVYAQSPLLTAGTHQWGVQAYMISSRSDRSINSALNKFRSEKINLEKIYNETTDPVYQQELLSSIAKIDSKVLKLKLQYSHEKKPIDTVAELNIEVQ